MYLVQCHWKVYMVFLPNLIPYDPPPSLTVTSFKTLLGFPPLPLLLHPTDPIPSRETLPPILDPGPYVVGMTLHPCL